MYHPNFIQILLILISIIVQYNLSKQDQISIKYKNYYLFQI